MFTGRRADGTSVTSRTAKHDPAGRRLLEAGDHPEGRRLAAAARSEEREELALLDREVDVDHLEVAEELRHLGEDDVAAACLERGASAPWRSKRLFLEAERGNASSAPGGRLDCRHVVERPERQIVDEIEGRRDELVQLTSELVRFDTTARNPDDPPRDEVALQNHLARRLRDAGAEVDPWEPSTEEMAGRPLVPPGLGFEGRPQLLARFKGAGGGKSLLFNGHIDGLVEPIDHWTSNPFEAEVRDGNCTVAARAT